MMLINSVPYYKVKGERLRLKEDKEARGKLQLSTYSGNVFHCDTVLGKKECKDESVCAKGW